MIKVPPLLQGGKYASFSDLRKPHVDFKKLISEAFECLVLF
jgi:hypothetical protein